MVFLIAFASFVVCVQELRLNTETTINVKNETNAEAVFKLPANTRLIVDVHYNSKQFDMFLKSGSIASASNFDAQLHEYGANKDYTATLEPYTTKQDVYFTVVSGNHSPTTLYILGSSGLVVPHALPNDGNDDMDLRTLPEYDYYTINITKGDTLQVVVNKNQKKHYSRLVISTGDYHSNVLYEKNELSHSFTSSRLTEDTKFFVGIKQGDECFSQKLACEIIDIAIYPYSASYQLQVLIALGVAFSIVIITCLGVLVICVVRWRMAKVGTFADSNVENEEEDDVELFGPEERLKQLEDVTPDEFKIDED